MNRKDKVRCHWVTDDDLYIDYHDREWGVSVHDDRVLFEYLILEGAQAGLSWFTILKKREGYRQAFHNFDPKKVAKLTAKDVDRLMQNPNIVRNRLKILATINNAQRFLEVQKEFGSFDKYCWGFVGGKTLVNQIKSPADIVATSVESDALSKDLRKRGFKFVGSTIIYAFMQAVGMVDDHSSNCFRKKIQKK